MGYAVATGTVVAVSTRNNVGSGVCKKGVCRRVKEGGFWVFVCLAPWYLMDD